MAFLTDRKRATGMGSAREGTNRHWSMTMSSMALLVLIPLFLCTFGSALGGTHAEVTAHFARPYPALVTGLTLLVASVHFKNGVRMLIEDYVHGTLRKVLIIGTICLSYAAAVTGIFAILRIAL